MGLREIAEFAGIVAVLGTLLVGLQLIEWGSAAELPEPTEVDSVELPSPVDVRVGGAGVRAVRARALSRERRIAERVLEHGDHD